MTDNDQITLFVPSYSEQLTNLPGKNTKGHCISALTEYTACISDTYLQKLENPKDFVDEKLEIQHRVIPVDPDSPIELYLAMQKACTEGMKKDQAEPKLSNKRKAGEMKTPSPEPIPESAL